MLRAIFLRLVPFKSAKRRSVISKRLCKAERLLHEIRREARRIILDSKETEFRRGLSTHKVLMKRSGASLVTWATWMFLHLLETSNNRSLQVGWTGALAITPIKVLRLNLAFPHSTEGGSNIGFSLLNCFSFSRRGWQPPSH